MPETTREVIISAVGSFPAMSATAAKVLSLLGTPDTDIADIEESIKFDPGLTANILKLANSAYFGFPGTVSSVKQAVAHLGWKRMYQLVVASAVNALMERPVPGYDLPRGELWRQAIAGAVSALAVNEVANIHDGEEAFTAALLRDIGKMIIGDYIDSYYQQIEVALDKGISFEEAEREVLGTDHSEVGGWILKHWSLPGELVDAVRWHSRPDDAEKVEVTIDVVHVADAISMAVSNGLDVGAIGVFPDATVMNRLGLTPESLPGIVEKAQETFMAVGDNLGS
jgi:HD-like signal output (HDOD) protein